MTRLHPTLRLFATLLALTIVVSGTGCVKRRLTVRSNPPGARVFVDRQEIGVTPVSTSFTYYAPRRIELVKEGYETLNVLHSVDAPWYEYPPLDFFVENFAGQEIRDERVVDFQLIPQQTVPNQVLLERAQALRNQAMQGHVIPLITPPAPPAPGQPAPPPFTFPGTASGSPSPGQPAFSAPPPAGAPIGP